MFLACKSNTLIIYPQRRYENPPILCDFEYQLLHFTYSVLLDWRFFPIHSYSTKKNSVCAMQSRVDMIYDEQKYLCHILAWMAGPSFALGN